MYLYLIVLWAFVGWRCGNEPRPLPPPPDPVFPPPPKPICRVCGRVLGALAGILGGWAFTQMFLPEEPMTSRSGIYAAATAVGAFALAGVATDIYGLVSHRGR
jgi:hypothetical protein